MDARVSDVYLENDELDYKYKLLTEHINFLLYLGSGTVSSIENVHIVNVLENVDKDQLTRSGDVYDYRTHSMRSLFIQGPKTSIVNLGVMVIRNLTVSSNFNESYETERFWSAWATINETEWRQTNDGRYRMLVISFH